jgi:hypothetical protein
MSTVISVSPKPQVVGLFAQTADGPVVNGTLPLTIIGPGVGSLTVPRDYFKVGDSFRATLMGHITNPNNETIVIKTVCSTGTLSSTGTISLNATTNKHWQLDVIFTIRAIGGPGVASILSAGQFTYTSDPATQFEGGDFSIEENMTFDTGVPQTLDVLVQWGSNDPTNVIYCESFVLTKIY